MRFTTVSIASLSLPEGKSDLIVFDDALPGFGIRLRAGGKRTFIVQYRVGTQQRRLTIGPAGVIGLAAARQEARRALGKVASAVDPQVDKAIKRQEAGRTLGSLLDAYLETKKTKLRERSYSETKRALKFRWSPLHSLPVKEIDRGIVSERLAALAREYGGSSANRARAELSAFFTWAIKRGHAIANPVLGTDPPAEVVKRDRVLTDNELAEVWRATRDDDYGKIIRLLILTGQRRDEVAGMRWPELDLVRGIWLLPGERAKNGLPNQIPLSDPALSIIADIPRRNSRDLLFGSADGPFSGFSRAKKALDKRVTGARHAQASTTRRDVQEIPSAQPWRIHDLRRTAATGMAELGVLPHVVEAILNHISGTKAGVAGIYNRAAYAAEKRAALALWATHVQTLVTGADAKIVPLRRA